MWKIQGLHHSSLPVGVFFLFYILLYVQIYCIICINSLLKVCICCNVTVILYDHFTCSCHFTGFSWINCHPARHCFPGAEGNSKVGLFEKDWARNPGEMGEWESISPGCTSNSWGKYKVSICCYDTM